MAKVLSIVPYNIFPARVGGQKGIALFNKYFAKECELVCVTVKTNEPRYAKEYEVFNILSTSSLRYINVFYFFKIKKIIQKNQFTHLLLEHPYLGWLGILLKRSTGIKLIIHSHNIEATRWRSLGKWWWKILWWYEGTTHRYADYNFFIQDDDLKFAMDEFRLDRRKCTVITYGIEEEKAPPQEERNRCKNILQQQYQIAATATIFLFNGALDYRPNYYGVINILEKINPILLTYDFSYKILICGRGLPTEMDFLKDYEDKNVIYAGFVDDITVYFKGADIFINPVVDGGGIKTKLVEALGYNTKAVSTRNGSIGVEIEETGGQLKIVPDKKWNEFAQQMLQTAKEPQKKVPAAFYKKFYWGNIVRKAAEFIEV